MTKARDLAGAANSAVNSTEIGYLDGVTSSVQTQLDAKIAKSLVDAKGDLVAATANDTPGVLTVGSNGETLVADSSATTGLRWTATPSASNPVINGAFDIWQRGTSFSLSASSGVNYIADRWSTATNASQACTVSRQTTSDTTNLPNIQYCLRYQRNSGQTGTGGLEILNNFETVNSIPFAGKTVTLSFYARKGADYSPTSSLLAVYLVTGTGTDQSAWGAGLTGQATPINSTVTLTTTWQRFTLTATLNTNITQLFVDFRMNPTGTAGTNDYYEVTGVQIDLGSVALPFRRSGNTLAGELAACYRYYFRYAHGVAFGAVGMGVGATSTTAYFALPLPVEMRVTPTAVDYSSLNIADQSNAGIAVTSVTLEGSQNNKQVANIIANTASGITQYRPYMIRNNNSTSGYLGFTAEL